MNHVWTEEDRDIVRRDYKGTNASAQMIADKLGVTFYAVKGQATKMGILQPKSPPWTDNEIELLQEMVERLPLTRIAKKLHRSVNAVVIKSRRLGCSRRARDGWYTKMEVCEILGINHHKVQSWIDGGALIATWHSGHKPSKKGMAMWHIEAKDLRDFIITCSGELVCRNVDIQQIVWIVAG